MVITLFLFFYLHEIYCYWQRFSFQRETSDEMRTIIKEGEKDGVYNN